MAKVIKKTKAVAKKTAKPVVKKKATKPVAKKVTAKPVKKVAAKKAVAKAKPAPKKAAAKAKPVAKKVVKPLVKVKPIAKKAKTKIAPKPVARKVVAKKVVAKAKPAPKKVTKPAPKPVAKKVVAKSAPKPVAKKATPKPAVKIVEKKAAPKPEIKKAEPKPMVKPIEKTATEKAQQASVQRHIHDAKPLMEVIVTRYSDGDLAVFKGVILKKIAKAKEEIDFYSDQIKNTSESETQFASIDDGSMTSERENMNQIVVRMQKLISHLESALVRIENKSYGICRETGRLIPKERLLVVPHATLSVEGKKLEKK